MKQKRARRVVSLQADAVEGGVRVNVGRSLNFLLDKLDDSSSVC